MGKIFKFGSIITIIITFIAIRPIIIYFSWNWVLVDLFNFPKVTPLQSLALSILAAALFDYGRGKR